MKRTRAFKLELGERKADSKRTFSAVLSTETPVRRRDYDGEFLEVLSHAKGAVDLSRAPLPLIESHDQRSLPIGIVENVRIDGGKLRGDVTFGASQRAQEVAADVDAGIVRSLSIGYAITTTVEKDDGKQRTITATRWMPYEASAVAIGADAGAGFNRSATMKTKKKTQSTPTEIVADPVTIETRELADDTDDGADDNIVTDRERSLAITRTARSLGQSLAPADRAELERIGEQLVRSGVSLERAKARLVDEHAERGTIMVDRRDARIEAGRDGGHAHARVELMAEALASRFGGPPPSDEARQYARLSTLDFAKHFLEQRGVSTRMMSRSQIIERSLVGGHTTGDFPHLLTATGNRMLRAAYEAYTGGLQRACKQSTAPDFRPVNKLQLGEVGTLKKVNEGGEFENTTAIEAKEAYSLETFGRIFGLSRQAIINDDLSAFSDMSTRLGRAAAEFIAAQLVAKLVANPALAVDSTALFHANHGNLTTGPGTVISVTSLGVAKKLMRQQKGLDGTTPIDVTPKYIVVPSALETIALQTIAQITPAQTSNVNPFAGQLEAIVDPRLDATSATAWYLAADPALIDGIEYAFLDGTGPELFVQEGFRTDGMEWKIRLDFGCGVLDFRGWYRNDGA